MKLKFHVLSFASEAKDIVDITQSEISGSTDDVIWNLRKFDYHSRSPAPPSGVHLQATSEGHAAACARVQATGRRRAPTCTPPCTGSTR